jgi:hypothetical protein
LPLADESDGLNAEGMIVYNESEETEGGSGKGLYVWNGETWLFAGQSGTITIPVDPGLVTDFTISASENTIFSHLGMTILTASDFNESAVDKTVIWSKVSGDGEVTTIDGTHCRVNAGQTVGTIVVQAQSADEHTAKTYDVVVNQAVLPTSASLEYQVCGQIRMGYTGFLKAYFSPGDVTWKIMLFSGTGSYWNIESYTDTEVTIRATTSGSGEYVHWQTADGTKSGQVEILTTTSGACR